MKKTTLRQAALKLALVAFVLLSPLGLRAQETLTVYDETTGTLTTNNTVPMYGNYFDAYAKSEFVIPADQLSDMNGGTITSLKFYIQSVGSWGSGWSSNQQVFLKEVSSTSLSAFSGTDDATIVWEGSFTVPSSSDTEFEITFTTSYEYQGGNLLVGIYNITRGGYRDVKWYGQTVNGASGNGQNSSSLDGISFNQRNFIPKTTFTYEPASDFPKPRNLQVNNVTGHEATLIWETPNDATPTGYFYHYKKTTDANFNPPIDNGTILSVTLNSLDPETEYQFGVYANYANGASEYKEISFITDVACPAPTGFAVAENGLMGHTATLNWQGTSNEYQVRYRTAAYMDGIEEGFSANPTGWLFRTGALNADGTATLSGNTSWTRSTSNGVFDKHIYMNMYSYSGSENYWLITPSMEIQNGYVLSFDMAYTAYSGTQAAPATNSPTHRFAVLISTDNMQHWTILREWNNSGSEYVLDQVSTNGENSGNIDLSTYAGQTAYIAFFGHAETNSYDNNFHFDNVTIGIPVPAGEMQYASNITEETVTLQGLLAETEYEAWLQGDCGSEGLSTEVGPVSFTTEVACQAPTTLTNGTPSPSQVELTWVKNGEETEWQICINNNEENLVDVADADVNVNPETNVVTYTLTNLTPSTSYEIKVRANCGDVDGPSAWTSPVSFTTQAACPTPVLNADGITNITAHTADVEWSNFTENTNYEVSYRTAAYFDGVTAEFGTTMPNGWAQYTGLLNENGTATLSTSTYAWSFGSNNGVFNNHARVNIYSNNQRWLITSALTVPENGALTFDMALTAYSGTLAAPETDGTDDKFVVLITTDEMATWTVLREWNNSGSEYVYNNIPCSATGENVMIDLGDYVGQTVRIAFYGESTIGNADNNLHIDNVGVGVAVAAGDWETESVTTNSFQLTNLVAETPYDVKVAGYCGAAVAGESDTLTFTTAIACPVPTGLDTVGDATTNSVDLTWTAGAANQDAWQICLNGDETNLLNVTDATVTGTTVTYTLTGLTSGAYYSVKVRANCGGEDGVSLQWTNTVNFTTEASCTEPTAFAVVENSVEAHQAQLSWTAGADETAWDVYYSTTATEAPVNGVTEPTVGAITANPYTLAGLDAATTYYVWVRAHCGDAAGQQSPWVGPTEFRTACEAITTFPWSENFESYAAGNFNDPCWVNELISGNGTQIFKVNTSTTGNNTTHQLQLPDMSEGTLTKLVLPEMTLPNANYQFVLDVYRNNSTYNNNYPNEGIRVYASTDGEIEGATELTFIPRQYNVSSTLIPEETAQGWYTYEIPIGISGTCYIILRGESQYCTSTSMDNLTVEEIPSCARPTDLAKSEVTNHSATLTWTAGDENQHNWQVAYSKTSFDPNTASFDINTVETIDFTTSTTCTYRMDRLFDAASTYYLYIRANCGTATEPDYGPWSRNGISLTTSAANPAPSAFTASNIASTKVDLVWNAGGGDYELSWDLYYEQSDDAPTAPTDETPATKTVTTLPTTENPYTLDDLTEESRYYIWVRANHTINSVTTHSAWVALTGNYFTTLAACSAQDPVVSNITHNTATVTWDGESQDGFTVKYRTSAGVSDNSLFSEDFEDETTFANWTFTSMNTANDIASGKAGCLADAKHNGDYGFRFSSFSTKSEGTYDQYLVSPELNVTGVLNFFYKKYNNNTETLQVGYSTTTDDYATAFTWIDLDLTTSWQQSEDITLPDNVKYIAFHYYANCQYYVYLDDINIWEPTHAGAWQTKDATDNTATITSLTAETKYDVKVVPDCDETQESTIVTFTTKSLFEKVIEANKWYAIASPMHNDGNNETLAGVNNLTSGTYDLYGYNEGDGTWVKPTTSLNRGKGYIYRRSEGTTLQFVGIANTGNVPVSLTASCEDNDLKGFNLIGNPYPHTVAVSHDFYTLEPEGTWMAKTSGNTITAAEACLVQYTYSTTYTFSDETPTPSMSNTANSALAFTVSNGEYSDVAYARFDNGEGLRKIGHLNSEAPMLSIPVEGSRYAIANLGSDCQSFNLVFRGVNGTYTIKQSSNQAIAYCHLIDRVAGKDIDMLRQNYTFSSNGFDPDRFMVKLSPDAQENANGNFAYWNGNNWMVEGNGTLQVFDALGRQLFSQEISNSNFEIQNSLFPAAGVYVLRMGEKTQKIVVR